MSRLHKSVTRLESELSWYLILVWLEFCWSLIIYKCAGNQRFHNQKLLTIKTQLKQTLSWGLQSWFCDFC